MHPTGEPDLTVSEIDFHPLIYLLGYATASLLQDYRRNLQAYLIENTRFINCRQCSTDLGTGLYDCESWPGGISTTISDGDAVYTGRCSSNLVPAGTTRVP